MPIPPSETALVDPKLRVVKNTRNFTSVVLDAEGWSASMVASWIAAQKCWAISLLVVAPDGHWSSSTRYFRDPALNDRAVLVRHLQSECLRIVGTYIHGTTPTDTEATSVRAGEPLEFDGKDAHLGQFDPVVAGRVDDGYDETSVSSFGRRKRHSYQLHTYHIAPHTRRRAAALLGAWPWMRYVVPMSDLEAVLDSMGPEHSFGPPVPALVVAAIDLIPVDRIDRTWPWTAAAIACMAEFDKADPGAHYDPPYVLSLLSCLPKEWMPSSQEDYVIACRMSAVLYRSFSDDKDDVAQLFAHMAGRWREFWDRCEAAADVELVGNSGAAFTGIDDMIDHVSESLVKPVMSSIEDVRTRFDHIEGYDVEARSIARRLLTPDGGLVSFIEKSLRWHDVQDRLPTLDVARHGSWPALSEDFRSTSGLVLSFIETGDALVEEGDVMEHCVGSYVSACHGGRTHVASVGRLAGGVRERISTVQIDVDEGVPSVEQHFGRANTRPPDEAKAAVAEWVDAVVSGRIRLDADATARRYAATGFRIPEAGMPSDWRGILQRRIVRMTWQELVAEIEAMLFVGSKLHGEDDDAASTTRP